MTTYKDAQSDLIPDQVLIYEHANGVTYARYRDPPHNKIERWIVGGEPGAVARAQGQLLDYNEWEEMCDLAQSNVTLKKYLDKLVQTYYLIKDAEE